MRRHYLISKQNTCYWVTTTLVFQDFIRLMPCTRQEIKHLLCCFHKEKLPPQPIQHLDY